MLITTEDLIGFLKKYPGYNVRIFSLPDKWDMAINELTDIDIDVKNNKIIFDGQYERKPKLTKIRGLKCQDSDQ